MRRFGILAVLVAMLGCAAFAQERQSVGLVLSGGGAKGIAHIGVIKAFEDNDIPIDYITGTSMGAIVGGLYASGFTPEEMIALLESKGFAYWSTGRIDPSYTYYFLTENKTPSFVNVNLGKDSTQITSVLPMSLINPIPMNYAFFELFSPYGAQCGENFDRLFVPFRCVTSDVYAKHKVVLKSGSLGDAIRMSMSFPMIFEPITLDGVPMYDGGIYDNYPVDVMMEEFDPDAVIGINVGSKDAPPGSRNMLDQVEEMIMQPNDYPFPYDKGINIRINLDEFGLLDWDKCREIYQIGYESAMAKIDSIKMKVSARAPMANVAERRAEFKRATPEVKITGVKVSGGHEDENSYLASFFHRKDTPYLTLEEVRDAYYRAVASRQVQNFIPTPVFNPADSTYSLDFKAVIKDNFNVGIGGYISSSTNSMLFFNGGYNTLNFRSIKASVNAWLGQSYLAAMSDFKLQFNTYRPTEVMMRVVASRHKYHETEKLFYQINDPDFIRHSEVFVQGSYSAALSLRSVLNVGIGYGHLTDRYYADIREHSEETGRDTGVFNLGKIMAQWERNTFDNQFAPTEGSEFYVHALGVYGKYHYRPGESSDGDRYEKTVSWVQGDLSATNYWDCGKYLSVGAMARALLSTRKLLSSYDASVVAATAFHPTPSSYNHFNSAFRANSFLAVGVMPVWKISSKFQLRGTFDCFLPMRKIMHNSATNGAYYGKWLSNPEVFGEVSALLSLPFGTVSAYGNYTTAPSGNWNFGISIGAFILAPKFLE